MTGRRSAITLSEMPDEIPEEVLALPVMEFAPGEVIITEGRKPEALYFLDHGSVEIFKGEMRVARESQRGASFGDMALLLDLPGTATVRAVTSSRFFVARDAAAFLRSHPHVLFGIACQLAERLEAITRYVADVKSQFHTQGVTHLEMIDSVVESLLVKTPRRIPRTGRGH
jgi:CRP-like cAMP-binding protein